MAVCGLRLAMVELLITRLRLNANMTDTDTMGAKVSPLLMAIDSGNVDMVQLLVKLGARAAESGVPNADFSKDGSETREMVLRYLRSKLQIDNFYYWMEYRAKLSRVKRALSVALSEG